MPRSAELIFRLIFRISTMATGISFSVRLRRVVRGKNSIVVVILLFSEGCVKASVRQKVECKNKEGNCLG